MSQHSRLSTSGSSRNLRRHPSKDEVYSHSLRIAYLKYLQQPRKRITVAAPQPVRKSYTSSATSVLTEFANSAAASKSAKLPKGADFLTVLQRRLEAVITGREPHLEYKDKNIQKTFALFLNQLMEPKWRASVMKSRRAEDLLLIFVSHSTRELNSAMATGGLPNVAAHNVGLLVDRHIALFVRLILFCLKDNGWESGYGELLTKLQLLEQKLLAHDQNLAEESPTQAQITQEAPLTYNINDMPMAQIVGRIFQVPAATVQNDINRNRTVWTEEVAIRDLKLYNENLNMNKHTLKPDDFDTDAGYDNWKKNETKSVINLVQQTVIANPSLAAVNTNSQRPTHLQPNEHGGYGDSSDNISLNGSSNGDSGDHPYTFIPPDARACFKYLLKIAMLHDLHNFGANKDEVETNEPVLPIYHKETLKLVEECCLRWRIPDFSKAVLFLEVTKDRYLEQRLDLDAVDQAFEYYRDIVQIPWSDWTMPDQNTQRKMLASLHDGLLAELHKTVLDCYGAKTVPIAPIIYVLNSNVRADPLFSKKSLEPFVTTLTAELKTKAGEIYYTYTQDIPQVREEWDMYHVVDLGKKLLSVAERMQKRYSEPVLKQISIPRITIEVMFPAFAEDVQLIIQGIYKVAEEKGEELDIQDAWDMYKKLVEVRDIYVQVFENVPFPFSIEDTIQRFVWRWLEITDSKVLGWVDNAIKTDSFQTRGEEGREPTNDERHSLSVDDIFRAFTQTTTTLRELNWGDQYQEAKFYTALSKSFGNGLTHYCEILETTFTAEMDRLTPEQEAELNKTQKEKLLSFFNTKEKIEPFQFQPETCVKFNNIEYAIQQLDLIESSINVDKCAAIIAQHAKNQQSIRDTNKNYVFTIKIVEAEDLQACDINGLSDPYVVLGDEYQKRLAKTRVVYSTLNPRFDETVEITTQGPVLLTATIWDYDTIGEHDYVGRQSIKLDPSFFGDFQPREFWLDLDTQGRLLLKVSMEGERDDIQFYFGRTFRTLKRTERDMARQITDKCSAYIRHCLSRTALKSLLSKGLSISGLSSYFSKTGFGGARPTSVVNGSGPSEQEVEAALDPLFTYFNENFEILDRTLTRDALINVMMKLWKEVLATLEAILVPPLSEKPSSQKPLGQQELDVVFKWLKMLFNFFSAPDETGQATGVAIDVLRSPKYHDLQSISFFYFETTEILIQTSVRIATTNQQRAQQQNAQRPLNLSVPGAGALMLGVPMAKRSKSVLMNRNLGTMRKAKEEKRKEAQAEASDDMILRILRMRPDAVNYLRSRLQEKERLAAQAAAEAIVQQSINAGKGGLRPGGLLGDRR